MTDTPDDLVRRIDEACVGHPHAKIPWPHRLLHDCRDRIEQQAARIAELEKMYQLVECERADDITALEAENARLRDGLELVLEARVSSKWELRNIAQHYLRPKEPHEEAQPAEEPAEC